MRIHDDIFNQDAQDVEWLPEVGRKGWIVLTKDSHIRFRFVERTALIRSGVRAFILVSGNLSGPEMADIFVKALPKIKKFAIRYSPPFIAKVFKNSSVEMWVNESQSG